MVDKYEAMDHDDELRTPGGLVVPARAMTWTFARSGGAGGQHVNTSSTKSTLVIDLVHVRAHPVVAERLVAAWPDGLRVTSQVSRSQWRNRQECLARMSELLDEAARPPAPLRRPSKPTRGSVVRRLEDKRRDGERKLGRRTKDW